MPDTQAVSPAIDRLARKCRVSPQLVEDAYPCTGLQAGLVAGSLQGLGNYVSRFVFDITSSGHEPKAVKTAFEKIYDDTAILRTRIIENGSQLVQVITREALKWVESKSLEKYLSNDRMKPVTLGELLARFSWIEQGDGKTYMVWSLHHCQYDESSFQLLLSDVNLITSNPKGSGGVPQRTPFAKFIKALSKIDATTSQSFWEKALAKRSETRRICRGTSGNDTFRTFKQFQATHACRIPCNSIYQSSVLAVTAWSLLVSTWSKSSHVLFGHVLSGRTSNLTGIQEVSGPTLATVPWLTEMDSTMTIKSLLDRTQELRSQILPYEQTGLAEYRKLVGTAAFDTLLSVRPSPNIDSESAPINTLKPQKPEANELNHPCCIFIETGFEDEGCFVKASYDDRWVDERLLTEAMSCFVVIVETLPSNLDCSVETFKKQFQIPLSIECDNQGSDNNLDKVQEQHEQTTKVDSKVMAKVQKIAATITGLEEENAIGPDTTLMQLGMDSLKTVILSRHLNRTFGITVPFKDITGPGRSMASIERSIQHCLDGKDSDRNLLPTISLLDIASRHMETISPPTKLPKQHQETPSAEPGAVLLTGATGYLGVEILRQCLIESSYRVIVLVRCEGMEDGLERVTSSAKKACWIQGEINSLQQRVQIWPSDLSKERLGLVPEHWELLTGTAPSPLVLKAIIHNGARVDFLHSYTDLEDANVRSTAILLNQYIASHSKSNFVFVTGGRPCPVTPDDIGETATRLATAGGYAQSKFVSEVLVHRTKALHKAAKMSIVHPGSIIGSANSGVANTDDFVWRYVAASRSMGCYVPAVPTKREWVNLTPVDLVASDVVSRALASNDPIDVVERCLIRRGLPVGQFWGIVECVLREHSAALRPVSEFEWRIELERDVNRTGEQHPLFGLSQLMLQGYLQGIGGLPPVLSGRMKSMPVSTSVEKALWSNVQYLCSKGFFDEKRTVDGVFVRSKA